MTCIAVFNQKGGVGKTATALNLAAAINKKVKNPLLIDLDPQGHLTQILENPEAASSKNIFNFYQSNTPLAQLELPLPQVGSLIASNRELLKVDTIFGKGPTVLNKLRVGLEQLKQETHIKNVIIDCCPYLGVLSLNAIFAADLVIVPVASDYLSLESARKVEHTLQALEQVLKRRVARRYLLTSYDRRRKMSYEVQAQLIDSFGKEVCTTTIAENVAIAESPRYKKDIFSYKPDSSGAKDYESLRKELTKQKLIDK
jgi:chromosome partitioning protein